MPGHVRTPIALIALQIKSWLTTSIRAAVGSSQCFIVRKRKKAPRKFIGFPTLHLYLSGPKPHRSDEGMGRIGFGMRHLTIEIITREDMDPSSEDQSRLAGAETGNTAGHWYVEESVHDAMQMYFEENGSGDGVLVEPGHLIGSQDAYEDPDDASLTISSLVYELTYSPDLTQDAVRT